MPKCSYCDATTRHIGETEVEAGWGKVEAKIGVAKIVLIHCQEHDHEFQEEIIAWSRKHGDRQRNRQTQKEE